MTKFSLLLATTAVVAAEDASNGPRKCGNIDIDSILEEVDMTDFDDLNPEDMAQLKLEFEKIKTQLPEGVEETLGEVIDEVLGGQPSFRGRVLNDQENQDGDEGKNGEQGEQNKGDGNLKRKQFVAKCKAGRGNVVEIDGFKFKAEDFIELKCDDETKDDLRVTGKDRNGHNIHRKISRASRIKCRRARFCRRPFLKNAAKMKFHKEFPASQTGRQCQDKEEEGTCDFECENPNHVVKNFEPKNLTDDQKKEIEAKAEEMEHEAEELLKNVDGSNLDDKEKEKIRRVQDMIKELKAKLKQEFGDLTEEEITAKVKEILENKTLRKEVESRLGEDAKKRLEEILADHEDLEGKVKEILENGELTDEMKKEIIKRAEGLYHKLQLFCDAKDDDEEGVWRVGGKDGPIAENDQIENMECGVEASSDPDSEENSSSVLTATGILLGLTIAYL